MVGKLRQLYQMCDSNVLNVCFNYPMRDVMPMTSHSRQPDPRRGPGGGSLLLCGHNQPRRAGAVHSPHRADEHATKVGDGVVVPPSGALQPDGGDANRRQLC